MFMSDELKCNTLRFKPPRDACGLSVTTA
jgi:hypothetical protein